MNRMKKCLVILAKTPFISDVKTRLSSKIGIKNTHIFSGLIEDDYLLN